MAKVKVLKESELIGGTDNSSVYPITHTKAVFNSDNKELDQILNDIEKKIDTAENNIASNANLIDTLEISLESTNEVADTALRILTFASTVENVKIEEQPVANKFSILYDIGKNYFVAFKDGKYYISFIGHENYNTTSDGVIKARKDRLFWSLDNDFIYRFDGTKLRYFAITNDERAKLLAYPAKPLDIPLATENSQGLMSAEDKRKINKGIPPWTDIIWSGHNMNEFTEFGEYYIHGERTDSSDNLPILNAANGHTIEGTLKVYDSSIAGTGKDTDKVVTQILSMSNRVGGDGHIWIRTGQGSSKSNLTWSAWEKLQGIFEKNNVTNIEDIDSYTTNGMYSGIYTNESKEYGGIQFFQLDTFLIITINGYAVSKLAVPQITQLLYKLPTNNSGQKAEIYIRTGYLDVTENKWSWGPFLKTVTNIDLDSQVTILTKKINQNTANLEKSVESRVLKEEGKSLIIQDFANSLNAEDNKEFIEVSLDIKGRIIKALKRDGTSVFANIDSPTINDIYNKLKVIDITSTNQWTGKIALFYGDSVTAQSNHGAEQPYENENTIWATKVCKVLNFQKYYCRGIGGATWSPMNKIAYIDAEGRPQSNTITNYTKETAPVIEGYTIVDGGIACWERITNQIPESIRLSIDMVFIFCHNQEASSFNPSFSKLNVWDTLWMESPLNIYGGDYDITDCGNAIVSAVMKLQTWCPNARIVIGTGVSGRGKNDGSISTDLNTSINLQQEQEITKKIANTLSIPCVDVWGTDGINIFNRNRFIVDGVHPTQNGGQMMAKAIIGGLKNVYPINY